MNPVGLGFGDRTIELAVPHGADVLRTDRMPYRTNVTRSVS